MQKDRYDLNKQLGILVSFGTVVQIPSKTDHKIVADCSGGFAIGGHWTSNFQYLIE